MNTIQLTGIHKSALRHDELNRKQEAIDWISDVQKKAGRHNGSQTEHESPVS